MPRSAEPRVVPIRLRCGGTNGSVTVVWCVLGRSEDCATAEIARGKAGEWGIGLSALAWSGQVSYFIVVS